MATRRTATKTTAAKKKPAPAPEVVEEELEELEDGDIEETADDTEDDELEELEEDEVAESAPAKKTSAAASITFGIRDLCNLIKSETGQDLEPRAVRVLIRKMARDDSGRVEREIKAGNRERYNWTGPNDPEVRAIVEAVKGGELAAEQKAKLDALKQSKAAKLAAEGGTPAKKTKKTAAKKPAPVEEVEDDEELELEDEAE